LGEYALTPARILARQAFEESNLDPFELVRDGTSIADLRAGWRSLRSVTAVIASPKLELL